MIGEDSSVWARDDRDNRDTSFWVRVPCHPGHRSRGPQPNIQTRIINVITLLIPRRLSNHNTGILITVIRNKGTGIVSNGNRTLIYIPRPNSLIKTKVWTSYN